MIYSGCGSAGLPSDQPYPASEWWRGLVVTAYMTGWRISELLALRRDDLDQGLAITRWEDNKGKRDERVKLHPVVVEHLRRMPGFDPAVFPWHYNRRTLQEEFARIQEAVASSFHVVAITSTRVFATFMASTISGGPLRR